MASQDDSEPESECADEIFDVDCIVAERMTGSEGEIKEYLIRWLGFSKPEDHTWEPEEHIIGPNILQQWEERKLRRIRKLEADFDLERWEALKRQSEEEKGRKRLLRKKRHQQVATAGQDNAIKSNDDADGADQVDDDMESVPVETKPGYTAQKAGFQQSKGVFRSYVPASRNVLSDRSIDNEQPYNSLAKSASSTNTYFGTAPSEAARHAKVVKRIIKERLETN